MLLELFLSDMILDRDLLRGNISSGLVMLRAVKLEGCTIMEVLLANYNHILPSTTDF